MDSKEHRGKPVTLESASIDSKARPESSPFFFFILPSDVIAFLFPILLHVYRKHKRIKNKIMLRYKKILECNL